MKKLNELLNKARQSAFYLWLLNRLLWRMIPFNAPHKFIILSVSESEVSILLPFRKANLNHIRGIHACALATLCEYTCGLQLMNVLDASAYRIILQKLEMEYLYQAKTAVTARFSLSKTQAEELIVKPLINADAIVHSFNMEITDQAAHIICKAKISWQVKPWAKVRTRV